MHRQLSDMDERMSKLDAVSQKRRMSQTYS